MLPVTQPEASVTRGQPRRSIRLLLTFIYIISGLLPSLLSPFQVFLLGVTSSLDVLEAVSFNLETELSSSRDGTTTARTRNDRRNMISRSILPMRHRWSAPTLIKQIFRGSSLG